MIIGIGSDIVRISRIEALFAAYKHRFCERVLAESELETLRSIELPRRYISFIAKRFAAKEAFAKAMGTGIGREIAFTDVYVVSDKSGKPVLRLSDKIQDFLENKYGKVKFHVSITDEAEYAHAFVIIEKSMD